MIPDVSDVAGRIGLPSGEGDDVGLGARRSRLSS